MPRTDEGARPLAASRFTVRASTGRGIPRGVLDGNGARTALGRAAVQAALRRVATVVAAEAPPERAHEVACEEAARLVGADCAWLVRFEPGAAYEVLAVVVAPGFDVPVRVGARVPLLPGSELEQVAAGETVVTADGAGGRFAEAGLVALVTVPVRLHGAVFGALGVAWAAPRPGVAGDARWLHDLAELVTLAVGNAQARAELARQARTDALTGLANLRVAQERLREAIGRGHRHDHPLTLALVDIDHFKAVNDGAGHAVGDRVLQVVATELVAATRTEDVAARLGGDEFAVVIDGSPAQAARHALDRVRDRVAGALEDRGLPHVTLSVGLCQWEPGLSPDGLQRRADDALQWAKLHGRDRVERYDADRMEQVEAAPRIDGDGDAERRARAAQGFWQSALDALTKQVGVLSEAAEVIAVNEAWRTAGRLRVGANYVEAVEAAGEAAMAAGLRAVLEGERPFYEVEYELDGRWLRMRANRFVTEHPRRVIVTHEDVTEGRRAEDQVRFQARLLDEVDVAVVAVDPGGRIVHFNAAAERLYGWPAAEAVGRRGLELLHPGDVEPVAALAAEAERTGAASAELEVHDRGGRPLRAVVRYSSLRDDDGRLLAQVAVTVDVRQVPQA